MSRVMQRCSPSCGRIKGRSCNLIVEREKTGFSSIHKTTPYYHHCSPSHLVHPVIVVSCRSIVPLGSSHIVRHLWPPSSLPSRPAPLTFELLSSCNKPCRPELPDTSAIALPEKKIGHIFNTIDPGRESSLIQVQNVLDNCVFFGFCQFLPPVAGINLYSLSVHSVTQGSFGYFVDLRSLPTT